MVAFQRIERLMERHIPRITMKPIDIVGLCELYDLKGWFAEHFANDNPWARLLAPDEVTDPTTIRYAIAFSPAAKAFDPYPNLELVSSAGAGVDALLGHAGLRPEIRVSRVIVEEQAQMIAAFALWFIVGWQRRMWSYRPLQAQSCWAPINRTPPSRFPVGILGTGKIGGALAQSLLGLGYPVTGYGNRARIADGYEILSGEAGLAKLAGHSQAVVNLLPLTDQTRGILSSGLFEKMRDDAILIQLGRGGHLVESDLIAALDQGRPAMAALDV
ncbi:MAG: NAD(P)-dependent oxidoreductase, partial [Pseudomonadota bacterium]